MTCVFDVLIALVVAVFVVDLLKVVAVKDAYCNIRGLAVIDPGLDIFYVVIESALVTDRSEGIVIGSLAEILDLLLTLACLAQKSDVTEHQDKDDQEDH